VALVHAGVRAVAGGHVAAVRRLVGAEDVQEQRKGARPGGRQQDLKLFYQCNLPMQIANAIYQCELPMGFTYEIYLCNLQLQLTNAIYECDLPMQFNNAI
jgi:hypothetical protein